MAGGTGPNILGGGYTAYKSSDGWYTIKGVPTMSLVSKGTKGAPADIEKDWLDGAVQFGQDSYLKNRIAYPIHSPHNSDSGDSTPEFLGFFKPERVGMLPINGKDQPVVFSDLKVKPAAFEKIKAGELPYLSPEIRRWDKRAISSVALLNSQPPHFPFPNITIKEVVEDAAATFSADLPKGCSIAKFEDGKERVTFSHDFDPMEEGKPESKAIEQAEKCCSHCKTNQETLTKMSKDLYGGKMEAGKPDSAPIEQKGEPKKTEQGAMTNIRMEDDPKFVARFAALEDKLAAQEKKIAERELAEKAKIAGDKAIGEDLKGYQIGEKTKAAVYKFAAEGDDRLKAYVDSVKEVAIKDSPRSLYDAEMAGAVKMNDPVIAKFGGNDPGKMETVARFAADYRTLKRSPAGKGMRISEEEWIAQAVKESEMGGKL